MMARPFTARPARAQRTAHGSFMFVVALGVALCPLDHAFAQSLIDAVQNGLTSNPAVEAQRQQLAARMERRIQAQSLRRATIQSEANVGVARIDRNQQGFAGPSNVFSDETTPAGVSIVMEQPLYTGGRFEAALSISEIEIRQAEARLRTAELDVIRGIVTAWADVRRDLTIIEVRKETIEALNELLMGAQERFRLGEATITQSAQAEARLAGERASLAVAQANLQTSQSTFERFAGLSLVAPGDVGGLPDLPANLDVALRNAMGVNPDLIAARLEEELAKARAREIATENNGRLSMRASVSSDRNQGFAGSRVTNTQVQARYSLPLWSGGAAPSRKREAGAQSQAARLSAIDFERQTNARVTSAWARLLSNKASLDASRQQVSAAILALRGARAEFLFGLGDQLNVLNQQAELSAAKISQAQNERDGLVAHYTLLFEIGALDATSFRARPARSAFEPVSQPAFWEEPLIRVQQNLDPKTRRVERIRERAVKAVFGPEQ